MKICCVFNYPSHYRFPVYDKMGRELGCDFFFFDTIFQDIKPFDPSKLTGFRKNIHSVKLGFKSFIWHTGIRPIFNRKYTHYIISGSSTYLVNWLILLWSWLMGKKLFIWCHGFHSPVKGKRSRLVARMFYAHADGLLMYNSYYAPNMIDIGCKPERIYSIHNSLDTHRQTEIYNSLQPSDIYKEHFGNDAPVAIYIGRIQKRKKIDMLIKAVHDLCCQGKELNLIIVGGISDDSSLEELTQKLGMQNRVWFYGPSYNEEENGCLLYNASVCVCPERVGLTSIHALSYGTPVVSNDNFENQEPEFQAILGGDKGSFYEEGSIISLSEHIWRWVNVSNEERNNIRRVARKTIEEEWSVDYQINLLNKVLY